MFVSGYKIVDESVSLQSNIIIGQNSKNHIEIPPAEDGNEPHIHIKCNNWGGRIAVKLKSPEYSIHKEWPDKFKNKKSKKEFCDFLDSILPNGHTRWYEVVSKWNSNHEKRISDKRKYVFIPKNFPRPDYIKLK